MTVLSIRPCFSHWLMKGLLIAAFLPFLPIAAQAQSPDTQALFDRINRLERDIRTLNRQIANVPAPAQTTVEAAAPIAGAAPAPAPAPAPKIDFVEGEGAISRVMVRLNELEQEVRGATGLAESMAHNIDLANGRLDKLIVDLDYRLARLEGSEPGSFQSSQTPASPGTPSISTAPSTSSVSKIGSMEPPTQPAPAYTRSKTSGVLGTMETSKLNQILAETKDGAQDSKEGVDVQNAAETQTAALPKGDASAAVTEQPEAAVEVSVQDQYKVAFNLTRQARYQEAEIAFKAFLDVHGDDPLAANANYWLGETYYVRKDFMQAAQVFFQAYQKFPKGAKAPDSLLKLGMSMAGMEKTSEACATFGKLRKEFGADLKANIDRALTKETKRLACK